MLSLLIVLQQSPNTQKSHSKDIVKGECKIEFLPF